MRVARSFDTRIFDDSIPGWSRVKQSQLTYSCLCHFRPPLQTFGLDEQGCLPVQRQCLHQLRYGMCVRSCSSRSTNVGVIIFFSPTLTALLSSDCSSLSSMSSSSITSTTGPRKPRFPTSLMIDDATSCLRGRLIVSLVTDPTD